MDTPFGNFELPQGSPVPKITRVFGQTRRIAHCLSEPRFLGFVVLEVDGGSPAGKHRLREESPGSMGQGRSVTPTRGNPRESATEKTPPMAAGSSRMHRQG